MGKLFMGNKCSVCYFIHCCDKTPLKNNLRDIGFILARSLRRGTGHHGEIGTVRNLRYLVTTYLQSRAEGGGRERKREEGGGGQMEGDPSMFAFCLGPQPCMVPPTFRVYLPCPAKSFCKQPGRNIQMCFPGISNPSKPTMCVNYHM